MFDCNILNLNCIIDLTEVSRYSIHIMLTCLVNMLIMRLKFNPYLCIMCIQHVPYLTCIVDCYNRWGCNRLWDVLLTLNVSL